MTLTFIRWCCSWKVVCLCVCVCVCVCLCVCVSLSPSVPVFNLGCGGSDHIWLIGFLLCVTHTNCTQMLNTHMGTHKVYTHTQEDTNINTHTHKHAVYTQYVCVAEVLSNLFIMDLLSSIITTAASVFTILDSLTLNTLKKYHDERCTQH